MSPEIVARTKERLSANEIANFIGYEKGSRFYGGIEGWQYQGSNFRYFEFNQDALYGSTIDSMYGVWANAQNKEYSGDGIVVVRDSEGISVGGFDGVTAFDIDAQKYGPLLKFASKGEGSDYAIVEMVRRYPQLLNSFFNNTDSLFHLESHQMDELLRYNRGGYWEMFTNRFGHESQNGWLNINVAFNLVNRLDSRTDNNPASKRPGVIGSLLRVSLDSNNIYRAISHSSIADNPMYGICSNGTIVPLFDNRNSIHDHNTVMTMRKLIENHDVANAEEARKLLIKEGYFRKSYNNKVNNNRPDGGVLVVNGSSDFYSAYASLGGFYVHGMEKYVAMVMMSDGFLFHLQDVDEGFDQKGLEMLLWNIIHNQNTEEVEQLERKSFNTNWPTRERLSDDKFAIVCSFIDRQDLSEVAMKLHYPF